MLKGYKKPGVRSIIFKDLSINQGGVRCGGCGGSFFPLLVYWGKNNGIVDLKETELYFFGYVEKWLLMKNWWFLL